MSEVYKPTTIRFEESVYQALHEVASEHGLSVGMVARIAITNRLAKYLGTVRYMDYDQGKKIASQIADLANTMSAIRNELHRIGVNYNQEVKLRQIEKRYAGKTDVFNILQREKEEKAIRAESQSLDMNRLEELIKRYEAASAKVGEVLCHMQE